MKRNDVSGAPARWLVPSLGSILALVAMLNALLFRSREFFAWDGDVGRHLRVGRTILDTGVIPRVDLFSHTRGGTPFVPYEWLSEVVTAAVHLAGGLPGVAVLSALLYATAVLGVYRAGDALGARRMIAFSVATLALVLQSVHLLPRPHLFTTALAAIFVVVLIRFARTGRPWLLAPLPPLMLVWANSHGGFLIGFILLLAFIAGALFRSSEFCKPHRALRPLTLVLALCSVLSLVNPAGPELWTHTTGYLGIDFLVDATQEYGSVDFHAGYGKLFFLVLFAGPVLWMTGRVRVSILAAGLYLFFAATALHSARNIPLFTVCSLPWLAIWIDQALQRGGTRGKLLARLDRWERADRQLKPGAAAVAFVYVIWFALVPNRDAYRFDPTVFPVEAMEILGGNFGSGHVFNQLTWGGYLLYARPDIPVFIDGQTDFYGEELSRDYLAAVKGHAGWNDVLVRYDIEWTLLERAEPLNQLLDLDPGWDRVYADGVASAYRRAPAN
ncbi:MAG: hypothetical protein OEM96_02095 [Gemmatimonadota bacterium]|nr:hypothetical protein [Gemmatimonadota bacterium]